MWHGQRASDDDDPLLASSVDDERQDSLRQSQRLPLVAGMGRLNIKQHGMNKKTLYWKDLFHTLVNIPNRRFFVCFVACYLIQFFCFGIVYYMLPASCIVGDRGGSEMKVMHAIWFSVRTSMTVGYSADFFPSPDCPSVNILITCQCVFSRLVDYSVLGLVYARFSSPMHRAGTIKFSKHIIMHEVDGLWRLTLRVANLRKHQLLNPQIRMLLAINDMETPEDESVFHFEDLELQGKGKDGCLALFLGLPSSVTHVIAPGSPLFGLSVREMGARDMEILVLMDGIDATTSQHVQARHSYVSADVRERHRFHSVVSVSDCGRRTVDLANFDATRPVGGVAAGARGPGGGAPSTPRSSVRARDSHGIWVDPSPDEGTNRGGIRLDPIVASHANGNGVPTPPPSAESAVAGAGWQAKPRVGWSDEAGRAGGGSQSGGGGEATVAEMRATLERLTTAVVAEGLGAGGGPMDAARDAIALLARSRSGAA